MNEAPPLARKLGIKPGLQVSFVNPPDGFGALLGEDSLRHIVHVLPGESEVDLALLFVSSFRELDRELRPLVNGLAKAGMLWVAWPKKRSGVLTDLTFDVVQRAGLDHGLVDTKICAIDDTWSALKFVRR